MRVDTVFNKIIFNPKTRESRTLLSQCISVGFDSRLLLFLVLCLTLVFAACSPKAGQVLKDEPAADHIAVENVEVSSLDGRSMLTIVTTSPLRGKYTLLKLPDPPKLIIEMPDVDPGKFSGPLQVDDGTIDRIDVSNIKGIGLRFEIGLTSPVEHLVKADSNRLEVYFAQAPAVEEAPLVKSLEEARKMKETQREELPEEKAVEETPTEVVQEEVKVAEMAPVVEPMAPVPAVEQPHVEKKEEVSEIAAKTEKIEKTEKTLKVKDIKVRMAGKVTTAEIVTDGDPSDYKVFDLASPSRVVVDISNARGIDAKRKIKVATTHISGSRVGMYDGKVRVVFDYKGKIKPYEVVKGKDRIVLSFGKKITESKPKEPAVKPATNKSEVKAPIEEKAEAAPVPQSPVPEAEVREAGGLENKPLSIQKAANEARKEEAAETSPVVQPADKTADTISETRNEIEAPAATKPDIKGEEIKEAASISEKVQPDAEGKHAVEIKLPPSDGEPRKAYTGQKVTLEFKDADIKNIFRVIAEVSGYNMIIDNSVSGKVTLRLVNVPWDQALDLILETNDLGMTRVGNVIRVLPMAMIKKEEESKVAAKKSKEKLEDLFTKLIPISYAKASDITARIKSVMSDRGTAEVDDRTNTIILKDIKKSIEDAEKLVRALDETTPQIVIEARIVEASTSFSKNLGIQWGAGYAADAAHGNPTGYYFPNSYNITGGGGGSFSLNPPSSGGVGAGVNGGGVVGINFGSINNTLNLDLRLSALETQGWGKVISSPKIVTLDNKAATIEQGYDIPYQTTSSSGTQTEFKPATLKLEVTPHATPDNRLNLKIIVNKDAPTLTFASAGGAPSILKNKATTELLVKDGETTVIGGIYQTTKGETETYTPFLGKIPIIGWLFKSKAVEDKKTELLIFITPRIIRDMPV